MKGFAIGLITIVSLCFVSCKKNVNGPQEPDTGSAYTPAVKPVGQPKGPQAKFVIGPSGGSFKSQDNDITVTIPAGAVNSDTEFGLQEVENTCAAGIGKSYSITPHGKVLNKPAIITYAIDNISTDFLAIASQDVQGIWRLAKNATIDRTNKKISVAVNHFSNWVLLQWLQLKPEKATLSPGQTLEMKVRSYIAMDGDLLTPLVPGDDSQVGVGDGHEISASFIKSWQLTGPGTVKGNGSNATYTAPAAQAGVKTAVVTVQLKDAVSQLLLLSNLTIMGEGIAFRIGGGEWQMLPGFVIKGNDQFNISCFEGDRFLAVDWPGGKGSFRWLHNPDEEKGEKAVAFVYRDENGRTYKSTFYEDDIYFDSGGSLVIEEWGEKNATIVGSFTISRGAYFYGVDDTREAGRTTVEAMFRLKRGN